MGGTESPICFQRIFFLSGSRAQKLALQHSRSGFKPKKSMEVIMFTSEELTRFGISCLGSKLCGGPILKKEGISIGVVTAIATPASIKVDLEGNGGHAILVQPLALQLYYSHNHSDLQLLPGHRHGEHWKEGNSLFA
ncbi:hypothetical protein ACET3Z_011237 [Daucus carota]